MQITLTAHGEDLLRLALVRCPHQSPAEIVEQALAERIAREAVVESAARLPEPKQVSREEFHAALARIAQFSGEVRPMPGETFPRVMIYQDHD